jgi:hypothetical protein
LNEGKTVLEIFSGLEIERSGLILTVLEAVHDTDERLPRSKERCTEVLERELEALKP